MLFKHWLIRFSSVVYWMTYNKLPAKWPCYVPQHCTFMQRSALIIGRCKCLTIRCHILYGSLQWQSWHWNHICRSVTAIWSQWFRLATDVVRLLTSECTVIWLYNCLNARQHKSPSLVLTAPDSCVGSVLEKQQLYCVSYVQFLAVTTRCRLIKNKWHSDTHLAMCHVSCAQSHTHAVAHMSMWHFVE